MRSIVLAWCCLMIATSSIGQAQDAPEIVRWDRAPISLSLAVGSERYVWFPGRVQPGIPPELTRKLRVQAVKDTIYLLASEPFPTTRLPVRDLDTGDFYLFDIKTDDDATATPVRVVMHMIVPGGGISRDRSKWISCRPNFFLPVRVLSRLFRGLILRGLKKAHADGRLQFFNDHQDLTDKTAFDAYLKPLYKTNFAVYAKEPFAGPKAVLAYLSRYTHRVAISNRRLISVDDKIVTFTWKDYRAEGADRYKTMNLPIHEFIRRFLIHVFPKRFHHIRHYGLLANGHRADNVALARRLLAAQDHDPRPDVGAGKTVDEQKTTEPSCPACGGRMREHVILWGVAFGWY